MKAPSPMNQLEDLFSHKLLCVSGKGGVGKSTIAASLAILAAKERKKVLLIESSAQEQLPALFCNEERETKDQCHNERRLTDGIFHLNLDGRECFREYVVDHLKMPKLYEKVFDRKLMRSFLESMPGLSEIMLLGRLFHTCMLRNPPKDYDLVIFDAPASGHFFSLFNTPSAVIESGLVGPLVKEITRVNNFLSDPKHCGLILATLPQELISSETLEFIPKIKKNLPIQIKRIVLNQSFPLTEDISGLNPKNPIESFAKKTIMTARKEQSKFFESLQESGDDSLYASLPDLGVLPEPWTKEVAQSLWGEEI